MSDADELFSAFNRNYQVAVAEKRQRAFEERIVKQILRYAGVSISIAAAKSEEREKNPKQDGDLSFVWLQEQFPGFPMEIRSSKIPYTHQVRLSDVFGSGFAKLPWFKTYRQLANEMHWDLHQDRCAMVFNQPKAEGGATMVLHNQPIQTISVEDPEHRGDPYTRVIRPYGNPQIVYVLEQFPSFMQTVGTAWAEF